MQWQWQHRQAQSTQCQQLQRSTAAQPASRMRAILSLVKQQHRCITSIWQGDAHVYEGTQLRFASASVAALGRPGCHQWHAQAHTTAQRLPAPLERCQYLRRHQQACCLPLCCQATCGGSGSSRCKLRLSCCDRRLPQKQQ